MAASLPLPEMSAIENDDGVVVEVVHVDDVAAGQAVREPVADRVFDPGDVGVPAREQMLDEHLRRRPIGDAGEAVRVQRGDRGLAVRRRRHALGRRRQRRRDLSMSIAGCIARLAAVSRALLSGLIRSLRSPGRDGHAGVRSSERERARRANPPRSADGVSAAEKRVAARGEMAERLNASVLKTEGPSRGSWVRIPLSPRLEAAA